MTYLFFDTETTGTPRHERFCSKNPENQHKCFEFCLHLIRERNVIECDHVETTFICRKTGRDMYSYIAERRGLVGKMPETTIRMPIFCPHYMDDTAAILEQRERDAESEFY